jgi:uncharacterized protein involved in exopolysaccharide biosynthesis
MTKEPARPSPASQTTAREFLAVVFRRRWLILGLFMVTTGTIAVLALTRKIEYQSTGRVLVKRGERESLLDPSRRFLQWEEELASEVQVIQSQAVVGLAQVILNSERDSSFRPRLAPGQVEAEVVGESNVLLIAYRDGDPEVAQVCADALVRGYIQYRNQNYALSYPRQFFDDELKRITRQLAELNQERRQFATSASLVNPIQQSSSLLNQNHALRQRLTEIESDLAAQRSNLEGMKRMASSPDAEGSIPGGPPSVADNVIAELKRQILNQQTRVAQLRERYLDESSEVRSAEETLQSLRAMMAREVQGRIEASEALVRSLEARRQVVLNEVNSVAAQIEELPGKESRLDELDRRIAVLKDSYEELSRRSDQARIAQATTSNLTVLLLAAAGKATMVNARDYVRLALAPIFSLLVGLGLAFFVDSLDTTVRTPGEAEQALQLPVLATLADRRRRLGPSPGKALP